MSTSWEYGVVSPARYPNPGRKKKSGPAKGPNPNGKKKKEKENETLTIQNMKPIGLDAFEKNEVTCSGEMPNDDDPAVVVEMMEKDCHDYIPNPNNPHCREDMVEVLQEGVSYPQPSEEETKEAVEEIMNELNGMVDQATQTPPPKPSLEDAFNSKVKLVGVYGSPEAFSQAMDNKRKVNGSTYHSPAFCGDPEIRDYHYMACPRHQVRLEERVSQNGWEYVECPMYPCLLFCAKEKALDYMREGHRQLHADVFSMWNCLLCFCREPATNRASPKTIPNGCF